MNARRLAPFAVLATASALALPAHAGASAPDPVVVVADDAGEQHQRFGGEVALDGDTMVVGAACDESVGLCSGSAYVFVRSGTGWTQEAKIVPADVTAGDYFGRSVAVSGDTIVVGSYDAPSDRGQSGSAYVFVRGAGGWTQQAELKLADRHRGDDFGAAVSIEDDTVVVGAPGRDVDGQSFAGAAYVSVRSGDTWASPTQLTAPQPSASDEFGAAVALDGGTILVGAPHQGTERASEAGVVHVFARSGASWTRAATITAPDGSRNSEFGGALALDGDTAAISETRFWRGRRERAYVFVGSGASWSIQARFLAKSDDGAYGDEIDVSGDTVAVGASDDSSQTSRQGAAFVYARSGATWSKAAKLTAPTPVSDGLFGVGVALDGTTLAVGSVYDEFGKVFVYER